MDVVSVRKKIIKIVIIIVCVLVVLGVLYVLFGDKVFKNKTLPLINKDVDITEYKDSDNYDESYYNETLVLKEYSKVDIKGIDIKKYNEEYYYIDNVDDNGVHVLYIFKNNKLVKKIENKSELNIIENFSYYCFDKSGKCRFIEEFNPKLKDLSYDSIKYHEGYNNYIEVVKDGKSGILDKDGNLVLDTLYDEVLYSDGFYYGISEGKINIYNSRNKLINSVEFNHKNNKIFFYENYLKLYVNYVYYIFSYDGKILFNSNKDNVYYDDNLEMFYELKANYNLDSISFYDKSGKFKKTFDLNNYKPARSSDFVTLIGDKEFTTYNSVVSVLPLSTKKYLIVDRNLSTYVVDNIHFEEVTKDNKIYFVNDYFYVVNDKDVYSVYKLNGEVIAEGLKGFYYSKNFDVIKKDSDYDYVLCKSSKECTLMNNKGELYSDFVYEYYKKVYTNGSSKELDYLFNDKDYLFVNNNVIKVSPKDEFKSKEASFVGDNVFILYDKERTYIYDKNGNLLLDKNINKEVVNDKNIIAFESETENSFIIDMNGKVINYKNDVKNKKYVTSIDNKVFFEVNGKLYFVGM